MFDDSHVLDGYHSTFLSTSEVEHELHVGSILTLAQAHTFVAYYVLASLDGYAVSEEEVVVVVDLCELEGSTGQVLCGGHLAREVYHVVAAEGECYILV